MSVEGYTSLEGAYGSGVEVGRVGSAGAVVNLLVGSDGGVSVGEVIVDEGQSLVDRAAAGISRRGDTRIVGGDKLQTVTVLVDGNLAVGLAEVVEQIVVEVCAGKLHLADVAVGCYNVFAGDNAAVDEGLTS